MNGLCVHSLRATAATNALSHEADIAKVQEWLGHANVSTTRLYDRRKMRAGGQPDVPGQVLAECRHNVLTDRTEGSSSMGRSGSVNHVR